MNFKIQIKLLFVFFSGIILSNIFCGVAFAGNADGTGEAGLKNSDTITLETQKDPGNNGKIKWFSNLQECLDAAKAENKLIFVDAVATWCGWCKKMEMETFKNPEVSKLLGSYICLRVIVENDAAFSGKYTVNEFPTILFLKPDGSEIERYIGFKNIDDFKKILEQIKEKKGM